MLIAEIIPVVRALPRSEKFQLVRLSLDDLAGEDLLAGLKPGQEFPIYTPEIAPEAAAHLAPLLKEQVLTGKKARAASATECQGGRQCGG